MTPPATADVSAQTPGQVKSTDPQTQAYDPVKQSDNLQWRCVSIDVEEYYHIEAAHGLIPRGDWDTMPSRVQRNIDLLLELFDKHNHKGTFFILGDVARRQPDLAKSIAAQGHEIASHGTGHDRLHRLDPSSFRQDLLDSKNLLEDQTGRQVIGYRAPTFSVVPQTSWAIDVLIECGFEYDASIFPVRHPWYGVPTAPDAPFYVSTTKNAPKILEVPPLTWRISDNKKLAVAGGGYFRLLPLWFMRQGLKQSAKENRPAVLYFHPWEFDPGTPKMPLPLTGRIRTYTGLATAERKLDRIMTQPAKWGTIADELSNLRQQADSRDVFTLQH